MQRRFFPTWPVAAAALAGLLALIATSLIVTSHRAQEIFIQLDQSNRHHREVEGKLRRLRADVHLSGIYIRDYLLDADRSHAPEYRQRLTELRESHATTVAELRLLLPPDVRPRIDKLETSIDDYWKTFDPLFEWTSTEKILHSARFLRHDVLPKREAVLAIAQEIEDLNDANLAAQRQEATRRENEFSADLHRRLWRTLLLGLAVAVVAALRLRSLEKRSEDQRRRAAAAEQEMRHLSQQLVAAQEEERKKLTRELHDHVGQMLTALRMEIGRAERSRGAADGIAAQALAEAKRLLDTILRSVRDLVMGLRPSMLDDFGLQPALEWHVRDFRRRFNVAVDLSVSGELSTLPDSHRTCVYRIVQEALTNCARHARAAHVAIDVAYDQASLDLRITDDGTGIDANARRRGTGLLGIEERVRELNGTFRIRARSGGGTELSVTLPVVAEVEEAAHARLAG